MSTGWHVDWSGLDPAQNVEASRTNLRTGETAPLVELLDPIVSRM